MTDLLVLACSVCYGEPGNPLTEGAKMGVIVLGLVIVAVLGWFVAIFFFWQKRAKALDAQGVIANARPATIAAANAARS